MCKKKILSDIKKAYKDLSNPNYGFVSKTIKKDIFQKVRKPLEKSFSVTDTTDINDEVSVVLGVCTNLSDCGIYLSMMGPYAYIHRLTMGNDEIEIILKIVEDHGFIVVDEKFLRQSLSFKRPNSDTEKATYFQVLFSDYDVMNDFKNNQT